MNEHVPQSASTPEYIQSSPANLRAAQWAQTVRFLTADFGHTLIRAWQIGVQVARRLHGWDDEEEGIDWDPDVTGVSPRLDTLRQTSLEKLRAIRSELTLRRSVRQMLRSHQVDQAYEDEYSAPRRRQHV